VPERDVGTESRWLRLGRLLPRSVRERVFEPAYADLLHRHLTRGGSRVPFALQVIATGLACLPVSVRWSLFRRRVLVRLTRVAAYSAVTLIVVATLLQLLTRVEGGY
jgi:hypothetical protein